MIVIQPEVDITRLNRAVVKFQKIYDELVKDILELHVQEVQHRITNTKASPDGEAWAPWSESYAATRQAGDTLLRETDELLNSFSVHVGSQSGEVISSSEYGFFLEHGSAKSNLPARPFMGVGAEEEQAFDQLIMEWAAGV